MNFNVISMQQEYGHPKILIKILISQNQINTQISSENIILRHCKDVYLNKFITLRFSHFARSNNS